MCVDNDDTTDTTNLNPFPRIGSTAEYKIAAAAEDGLC